MPTDSRISDQLCKTKTPNFSSRRGGKGNHMKTLEVYTVKTLEVYTVKTIEVYTITTLEVSKLSNSLEVIKHITPQHMNSCKYAVLKRKGLN